MNILLIFLLISICKSDDAFQNYTSQMKVCYEKFIPTLQTCTQSSAKRWNCAASGDKQIDLSCGEEKGRQCCPVWNVFDCQKTEVKEKCGEDLLKEFNHKVFDPQIKAIEDNDCQDFKYKSKECEMLLEFDKNEKVMSEKTLLFKNKDDSNQTHKDINKENKASAQLICNLSSLQFALIFVITIYLI